MSEYGKRGEERPIGSGVVNVVEALRRAAERPRTAYGWVHAGPGMLEQAADRIEKYEAAPAAELRLLREIVAGQGDKLTELGKDRSELAEVVTRLKDAERDLRRRAARTPIPSSALEEGTANGLELAANLLRDLMEAA